MKHPRFSADTRLRATVPAFSGGLDVSAAPSLIGDTALSDGCDMEYRDGALRTRTGFRTELARLAPLALGPRCRFYTDCDGYLLSVASGDTEANGECYVTLFDPDGVRTGNGPTVMGPLGLDGCILPAGDHPLLAEYTSLLWLNNGAIYGIHAADGRYELLGERVYIPTYAINGRPAAAREECTLGDRAEPFNMLTRQFACTYSTDGEGIFYRLPSVSSDSPLTVTLQTGTSTLTFTVPAWESLSAEAGGYQVCFDRLGASFWFVKDDAPIAVPDTDRYHNVTARACHTPTVTMPAVTVGCWFGDGRLFLGGGNRMVWSAAGNPLYIPVTAYAQIGAPDECITALGVQGDQLVVFKERSLYALTQTDTDTVTAAQVLDGAVTDVTETALFAVTPLHATVGCDLPQTVALFGNRLVWAIADGTVYTLGTGSALSQRTVTVISEPIRPLLRTKTPTHAAGAVHDGRYWLIWDGAVLCAEDESRPRWTRFSFEHTGAQALALCAVRGALRIPAAYTVGNSRVLWWFEVGGDADTVITHTGTGWHDAEYTLTDRGVRGMFCTKQFDFGDSEAYKHITRVFADATAVGAVTVGYLTEAGETAGMPCIPRAGVRLTPHITRCRRLAVRLCGEGLRVHSMTVRVTERRTGWQL